LFLSDLTGCIEVTRIVIAIIIFRKFNLKKKILDREKKQIKITISCTGSGSDKKMGVLFVLWVN